MASGEKRNKKRVGVTRRAVMKIGAIVIAAITVLAHILTNRFKSVLDGRFGRGEMTVTKVAGTEDWDTEYCKKDTASLAEAKAASDVVSEELADEGIVLLKNDGTLPLAAGSSVTPFGYGYLNPAYAGVGAAASADTTMVTPETALSAFFDLNSAAVDAMREATPSSPDAAAGTTPLDQSINPSVGADEARKTTEIPNYDPSIYETIANSVGGTTGIVFIVRTGTEGSDKRTEGYDDGTPHYLALTQAEKDTVKFARENCGSVVLVLNTSNPVELLPVMTGENEANAIVWVGTTGSRGFQSLAKVLSGKVNPSGRITDTYPTDFTADPTFANFGAFDYTNITCTDSVMIPTMNIGEYPGHFVEYREGIYVGYRYYETAAAEDPSFSYGTLDAGGAAVEPGAVAYPFGYGLSYTTFDQRISGCKDDDTTISVSVSVTNTGTVAGKEVVQLYFTSPYTDYDRQNGIEKPSTQLLDFAKTELLEPGDTADVDFTIPKENLASYAYRHENSDGTVGCYVLEGGTYTIDLKKNAHEVIDEAEVNVDETVFYEGDNPRQTDRDAQSLLDDEGNSREITYDGSPFVAASNRFQSLSDYMCGDDVTQLSRADWVATQPVQLEGRSKEAPQIAVDEFAWMRDFDYEKDDRLGNVPGSLVYSDAMPASGAQNGLSLIDLRGIDYHDAEWDALLDQVDWDADRENIQKLLYQAAYQTGELESVSKPATTDADGAMGWSSEGASSWASANLLASSWNVDLLEKMGECIGEEALQLGLTGWYAPSTNIHRCPFSGRTYEAYSEDPTVAGKASAAAISGAANKGVVSYYKHFAMNNQETYRNYSLATWANEQTIREIYLRPFEIAIKGARSTLSYVSDDRGTIATKVVRAASGLMTSYNLIGGVNTFAHYGLVHDILRSEWGYDGAVITDLQLLDGAAFRDLATRTGNDLFMCPGTVAQDYDSPTARTLMRESLHHVLFATANSNVMNGLTSGSKVTYAPSPWQNLLYGATAVLVAADALLVVGIVRDGKKEEETSADSADKGE